MFIVGFVLRRFVTFMATWAVALYVLIRERSLANEMFEWNQAAFTYSVNVVATQLSLSKEDRGALQLAGKLLNVERVIFFLELWVATAFALALLQAIVWGIRSFRKGAP